MLRTLNHNVETPLRVWYYKMREELENFFKILDKDHGVYQDLSVGGKLSLNSWTSIFGEYHPAVNESCGMEDEQDFWILIYF